MSSRPAGHPGSGHPRPAHGRLRALVAVLGLAVLTGLVPAGIATANDGVDTAADVAAAEARMLELLATERRERGLVPYRRDERLMALARERSAEMAATGQFSHTRPGGGTVFDELTPRGITWYAAGETIAWNNVADAVTSASLAFGGWMGSPPHAGILRADDLNYLGIGVAQDAATGRRYWTAVVVRGPDRSGAIGRMRSVARTTGWAPSGTRRVAVRWRGSDLQLQVLTAGLRDFQVQRRVAGGRWRTIRTGTTATRIVQTLERGRRYEYRVRARDRRGNYGPWSAPMGIRP